MASPSVARNVGNPPGPGQQIGQFAIRTGITVGGLLIIRVILGALPLSDPLYPTQPVTGAGAQAGDLGTALAQLAQALAPGLAGATRQAALHSLALAHLAIFPVTIANAVIDTLILLALLRFGQRLGAIVGTHYTRLPMAGRLLSLACTAAVAALAYSSYQGIMLPLLGPEHASLYGWAWLVIVAIPVIALVSLVARNLDAISAVAFHGAQAAVVGCRCTACGFQLESGARFCPNCGADSAPLPPPPPATSVCAGCGAQLSPAARFCKSCGQPAATA